MSNIKNHSADRVDGEQPSDLLFDQPFGSLEELATNGGWQTDFRQLDTGPAQAGGRLYRSGRAATMIFWLNRRFHQRGMPPAGMVSVGIPERPLIWFGVERGPDDLLNFNRSGGIDAVSPAGFSGTVLSLHPDLLAEVAGEPGLPNADCPAWRQRHGELTALHEAVHAACSPDLPLIEGEQLRHDLLNRDAVAAVLEIAGLPQPEPSPAEDLGTRRQLVGRSLEVMDSRRADPVSVAELGSILEVSEATLFRAFQESFGVGPKEYLIARSLSGVRTDLLDADAGHRVNEVAHRWGFWHMGRFAAIYRDRFGELPSQTRDRAATTI